MPSCNTGSGDVSNGECSGSYWGLISNIPRCSKRCLNRLYKSNTPRPRKGSLGSGDNQLPFHQLHVLRGPPAVAGLKELMPHVICPHLSSFCACLLSLHLPYLLDKMCVSQDTCRSLCSPFCILAWSPSRPFLDAEPQTQLSPRVCLLHLQWGALPLPIL